MKFPVAKNMQVDELIEIYDGILDQIDGHLNATGIGDILPRPDLPSSIEGFLSLTDAGDSVLPEDLTEVAGPSLGTLFSYKTQEANYVQSQMTHGKCELLVLKRNAQVVSSALKIYYREELEMAANMVADKVTTDTRYVNIDASVLRAEVFVKKVEARYEQHKRELHLISREQTRRGEEFRRTSTEQELPVRGSRWRTRD